MSTKQQATQRLRERRDVRARIARLRRRIDRNTGRLADRSGQLLAWRSCVARHPAQSLLAATGVGFVLATMIEKVRFPAEAGAKLYDLATGAAWMGVWRHLRKTCFTDPGENAAEPTDA